MLNRAQPINQNQVDTQGHCRICYGSGRIMGGGMLLKDCPKCGGTGKHFEDAISLDKPIENQPLLAESKKPVIDLTDSTPLTAEEKEKALCQLRAKKKANR